MTCVMDNSFVPVNLSNASGLVAKRPVGELSFAKMIPAKSSTFSVSHASLHPDAKVAKEVLNAYIPQQRSDMEYQRNSIAQHRQAQVRDFVEAQGRKSTMGLAERVIAIKSLLQYAAEKALRDAHKAKYPPIVLRLMHRTWQSLLQQAQAFLNEDDEDELQLDARCRAALENISALGVWFAGDISIPLRHYAVRVPTADGTLQDVIAIGLVSFTYSPYVMDVRRFAQDATLAELERLSTRLHTNVLFLPDLVVKQESPCDDIPVPMGSTVLLGETS